MKTREQITAKIGKPMHDDALGLGACQLMALFLPQGCHITFRIYRDESIIIGACPFTPHDVAEYTRNILNELQGTDYQSLSYSFILQRAIKLLWVFDIDVEDILPDEIPGLMALLYRAESRASLSYSFEVSSL